MGAVPGQGRERRVQTMTAHELAKQLAAGPDMPVVIDVHVGYGENEHSTVTLVEPIILWQIDYGSGWDEDLLNYEPASKWKRHRRVDALRLR